MAAGDPAALLTMARVPDAAEAAVGEYCTVKVTLCDGDSVTADPPDKEKLAPVKASLEIATFELPVFVRVTLREAVLPTLTFPKLTLEGFTVSVNPAATPAPLNAMADGGLDASLTSDRLPVEDPVDLGLNCTLKAVALPALSVIGRGSPEALKPEPEIFAAEIVTGTVPGLEI
jgi:hypothetical protein